MHIIQEITDKNAEVFISQRKQHKSLILAYQTICGRNESCARSTFTPDSNLPTSLYRATL